MKVQTARKNTSPIRIYHAHAMCTYGTRIARAERKQIRTRFPRAKIIDPDKYEGNIEKKIKGMKYCFELIKKCDALVFSRLLKKVTAGVGLEVRYALANHIRVYELRDEQIKSIKRPVAYLSRKNTIRLYETWRYDIRLKKMVAS